MIQKSTFNILLTITTLMVPVGLTLAQNIPIPSEIPDLEEQIDSTMNPEFPSPKDKVTITLEAYGTDINRADITWYLNDEEASSGKGQKTFSTIAPSLGETDIVRASITPQNGIAIEKTFYINPQNVDIVWQADTYTPPFYRGKAMFSPQTKVKLVALPNIVDVNGSIVNPKDITYKWKKDFVVQGKYSGYGIRTFSYIGDILMQPVNISLEASIDGGSTATNFININSISPEISLYEDSPIYGTLFNRELSSTITLNKDSEIGILAVPYFFDNQSNTHNLSFEWSINSEKTNVPTNQKSINIRNTENTDGVSLVSIMINDTKNFLGSAFKQFIINFEKSNKAVSL